MGLMIVAALLLFGVASILAQDTTKAVGLDQLKFLEGEWIGEGGGDPGQGTGGFSFVRDLQGQVLIRKSFAEYPATKDKPAFRHDDLIVIYAQPGDTMRATYWDNEGHVINYTVQPLEDQKSAVFVTGPTPSAPQFRLTYKMKDDKTVAIIFEIAPPGQPDKFLPYIEAAAHRK
jgi:hypothetical protein